MKLLKGFMAVALIATALTGSSFAAYDPANQAASTVADLADIGYASKERLSLTRAAVNHIFDATNPFNPAEGSTNGVKNAKAFMLGVIQGTVDRFAGADEPTKRLAFLAALDKVLTTRNPLEIDLTTVGFNPGKAADAAKITSAVDLVFAELNPAPANPRVALLAEAKALGIKKAKDGTDLAALEGELTAAIAAKDTAAVDAKIDGLKFGKDGGEVDLAGKLGKRKAKFAAGTAAGDYATLALDTDAAKIKAHYSILEADRAKRGGATGGSADDAALAKLVRDLFADGILTGKHSTPTEIAESLSELGAKVSDLEGALARSLGAQGIKVVQSGGKAHVIDSSHDLGGGQFAGGMNF